MDRAEIEQYSRQRWDQRIVWCGGEPEHFEDFDEAIEDMGRYVRRGSDGFGRPCQGAILFNGGDVIAQVGVTT